MLEVLERCREIVFDQGLDESTVVLRCERAVVSNKMFHEMLAEITYCCYSKD